jgi:hypothetical protein
VDAWVTPPLSKYQSQKTGHLPFMSSMARVESGFGPRG